MQLISVTGNTALAKELLPQLCDYYKAWEKTHLLGNGMFYSVDGYDAMELSISGTDEHLRMTYGIRPTLNSYLCADARALSELAELAEQPDIQKTYAIKYRNLRALINENLFKDGFYRAFHQENKERLLSVFSQDGYLPPRELIGYIPWMFRIPEQGREEAFELLTSDKSFYTAYGPATAERAHPQFLFEADHNCLWNGYVWPFATSQTLYALQNAVDYYGCEKYKRLYCDMLIQYAKAHTRTLEDGRKICWIDESRHPLRDEWYTRARLQQKGSTVLERGKDYNHSAFCDHVISGIVGVKASLQNELVVKPTIPDDWSYFTLSHLYFKGNYYDIRYDRTNGLRITKTQP